MKSTQAMRDRCRELSKPNRDDYDRAVICIIDDLEDSLKQLVTAVAAERERCAKICDDWVKAFGKGSIEYVPATEYATDAVCDIADLIRQVDSTQSDDLVKP